MSLNYGLLQIKNKLSTVLFQREELGTLWQNISKLDIGDYGFGSSTSRTLPSIAHAARLKGPGQLHSTPAAAWWSSHGPGISKKLESPLKLRLPLHQWPLVVQSLSFS